MRREDRRLLDLQAYHDGELSGLRRFFVARRIARDPAARRELLALRALGRELRSFDARLGEGDPALWSALRDQLPTQRRPAAEGSARRPRFGMRAAGWLGAGLAAAAAVAVALAVLPNPGDLSPPGSLRWLRSDGYPAVVLQDDREATIIWVLEGSDNAGALEKSKQRPEGPAGPAGTTGPVRPISPADLFGRAGGALA